MQIGHKMTELEAFEVLSVVLEHPVFGFSIMFKYFLQVYWLVNLDSRALWKPYKA